MLSCRCLTLLITEMKNDINALFVYGSLRSGFRNPAYAYLTQFFHLLGEAGEKPMYKREVVIAFQNGEPLPAWIYWYNGEVTGLPVIASGDVMDYLQQKNKPQ